MLKTFASCALYFSAAATLAGCGEAQLQSQPSNRIDVGHVRVDHRIFQYVGQAQSFQVPLGVTHVTIEASGASGPTQGGKSCYFTGGNGGVVKATITVKSAETLDVIVGGEGSGDTTSCNAGYQGGFNGGGNGGNETYCGNGTGGGGASDVREGGNGLRDRIIVAGGGGGGGIANPVYYAGVGGDGGGKIGGKGTGVPVGGYGGAGGTQHRGGKGGDGGMRTMRSSKGHNGKLGAGGDGGNGYLSGCGGGGGGGYYGGGGGGGADGASAAGGGGGGGGSSYVEPGATKIQNARGAAKPGNGLIVISWR